MCPESDARAHNPPTQGRFSFGDTPGARFNKKAHCALFARQSTLLARSRPCLPGPSTIITRSLLSIKQSKDLTAGVCVEEKDVLTREGVGRKGALVLTIRSSSAHPLTLTLTPNPTTSPTHPGPHLQPSMTGGERGVGGGKLSPALPPAASYGRDMGEISEVWVVAK